MTNPGNQMPFGQQPGPGWQQAPPPRPPDPFGYYGQPPQQQPLLPPAPVPPGQPRKKKGNAALGCGILAAIAGGVVVLVAVLTSGGSTPPAAPAPAATSAAAAAPASSAPAAPPPAPAPAPQVLATFAGSGIQNTTQFTIGGSGNWNLAWTYNCAAFGTSGNFIVDEDQNGSDFDGANVNELGTGGSGTAHVYGDAGQHFLEVNSECSWTLKVIGVR